MTPASMGIEPLCRDHRRGTSAVPYRNGLLPADRWHRVATNDSKRG